MPDCCIIVYFTLVFLPLANDKNFFFGLENRILYFQNDKTLLLLPMLILYEMFTLFW